MNHVLVSSCPTGKRQYKTQSMAKRELAKIRKESTNNNIPRRTYKCDLCSQWHLTSQNQNGHYEPSELNQLMDVDFKKYLKTEGMSKSSLDLIDRSPAHFKYALDNPKSRSETPAMRLGSIIHKMILERDEFDAEYIVMPDGLKKPTSAQINAKKPSDATIKQVEEWQSFESESNGKIIISREEYSQAEAMREAVFNHSKAAQILNVGQPEQSIFWNEPKTGELCKARTDWLHGSQQSLLVDIKSTNDARLHSFRSSIRKFRYNVQAAHYREGFGVDAFCFIAVEKEPPYGVAVYTLSTDQFSEGLEKRDENLGTYAHCKAMNDWPCYSEEILTI